MASIAEFAVKPMWFGEHTDPHMPMWPDVTREPDHLGAELNFDAPDSRDATAHAAHERPQPLSSDTPTTQPPQRGRTSWLDPNAQWPLPSPAESWLVASVDERGDVEPLFAPWKSQELPRKKKCGGLCGVGSPMFPAQTTVMAPCGVDLAKWHKKLKKQATGKSGMKSKERALRRAVEAHYADVKARADAQCQARAGGADCSCFAFGSHGRRGAADGGAETTGWGPWKKCAYTAWAYWTGTCIVGTRESHMEAAKKKAAKKGK